MIDAFGNHSVGDRGTEDEETEYFSIDENDGGFDDYGDAGPRDSIAISWGGFAEDVRDDEELIRAFEEHEKKLQAIKHTCSAIGDSTMSSVEDTKDISSTESEIFINGDEISMIDTFDEDEDSYNVIGNVKSKGKSVRFTEETHAASPATIACTICGHQFVPSFGSITYTIQFSYGGMIWKLDKRYSDFYKFHKELKNEKLVPYYELPELPQKRWFEGQRWLNRFEYKFTLIRRLGLQAFLRDTFRIEDIAERSSAVQNFVGLKERFHSNMFES